MGAQPSLNPITPNPETLQCDARLGGQKLESIDVIGPVPLLMTPIAPPNITSSPVTAGQVGWGLAGAGEYRVWVYRKVRVAFCRASGLYRGM